MADFWAFTLAMYGMPDVPQAALRLQDDFGAVVPVMMCGVWLGSRSIALDERTARRLADDVAAWNREIIVPLRTIRIRLKSGPSPAPDPATMNLREAVKKLELDAEQREVDFLQHLTAGLVPVAGADPSRLIAANFRTALACFNQKLEAGSVEGLAATLLEAALAVAART